MQITLQKGRVKVTLAKHERNVPASVIIEKLKRSKTCSDQARKTGASVSYASGSGTGANGFIYQIRPEQLLSAAQLLKARQLAQTMLSQLT